MNHKKRKQRTCFNKFYKEYLKCMQIKASDIQECIRKVARDNEFILDDYEWEYMKESSIEYLNWYYSKLPIKHELSHFESVFNIMYNKCYYINTYSAISNVLDLCIELQVNLESYIPEIKLGYKL